MKVELEVIEVRIIKGLIRAKIEEYEAEGSLHLGLDALLKKIRRKRNEVVYC